MVNLRSTRGCTNSWRVLMALHEAGEPVAVETVPDGTIMAAFGTFGPVLVDGELELVEPGAILRHVGRAYGGGRLWPSALAAQAQADRLLELQHRRLSPALGRDPAEAARQLAVVEAALARAGEWAVGGFSVVECSWAYLASPRGRGPLPLDGAPRVAAWLDRIVARPSFQRAVDAAPR